MFSRCCLQTLPPAAGPLGGSKAGTITAFLLWTCISSFPGTAVLLGAQGGWCFVGGSQPCNIIYCNVGQGLEVANKRETQQPPAHRQMWGRAGSWVWSGWSSTIGKKKIIRQKTAEFLDPAARLFLVTRPGWACQSPHEGFCFGFLLRSRN